MVSQKSNPSHGFGTLILAAFSIFGMALVIIRWLTGLGATTALTDDRGWGIWIGFDVLCGIALAAGAFTIAATVYIFQMKQFYPILRPTVLTALIGYGLAAFSIAIDLGFPHRIWHMIIHWNFHSPLFEVGCCVMAYSTVLALELSPIVFERFNLKAPLRLIRSITIPLVIVGVILSTMHQSSLGTLFILMPYRVHPLWYSGILPVLFLVSAISAGLSMVIVESSLSSSGLKHPLELGLLGKIARAIPYILGLYLVLRVIDIFVTGKSGYLFSEGYYSVLFWSEMIIGVILPIILFSLPDVRKKRYRLLSTAILVIGGFVLNRFNISLIAFNAGSYAPTWQELFITIGMIAMGALAFTLISRYLPVFSEQDEIKSTQEAIETEERIRVDKGIPISQPVYQIDMTD
ncbi:MAG: Ni/Fe-hydrogenase cytochrome b subunit [Anaerolineaceae bacterium]|nr:Ni/Fe-hydrogenase cytochrome b subunit [Anaerolineaceae bacterium]